MSALGMGGGTAGLLPGDRLRLTAAAAGAPQVEWFHFIVLGAGATVLVNLSSTTDSRGVAQQRVLVAVHRDGWTSEVHTLPARACDLRAGARHLAWGPSHLTLGADGYELRLDTPEARARLRLVAEAGPIYARGARLGPDVGLSWWAIPRMRVVGWLETPRGRVSLDGAVAYHDHNWGTMDWGADFGWEWGFVLPSGPDPWSIVHFALRGRGAPLERGVFAWKGARLMGLFRGAEVRQEVEQWGRGVNLHTVPKVLDSWAPSRTGLPWRQRWEARRGEDLLACSFRGEGQMLRLVVPGERRAGLVHEALGQATLHGRLGGQDLRLDGPAVLEVVNG